MIDYLYQLDYDDLFPSKHTVQSVETPTLESETSAVQHVSCYQDTGHGADAEVPVATAVPEVDTVEASESGSLVEDSWAFGSVKKSKNDKKKKKRKTSKLYLKDHGRDLATERLVVNTLMYALADKYAIENLKELAKLKFEAAMVQNWDGQVFAHAAELVFTSTPSTDQGLRAIVSKTLNDHRELVNYDEVRNLLDSGNGMAWAFVQVLLNNQPIHGGNQQRLPWGSAKMSTF